MQELFVSEVQVFDYGHAIKLSGLDDNREPVSIYLDQTCFAKLGEVVAFALNAYAKEAKKAVARMEAEAEEVEANAAAYRKRIEELRAVAESAAQYSPLKN